MQEILSQKVEEELYEMHSRNKYLEVFSNILLKTFLKASVDIRIMKAKIDELFSRLDYFENEMYLLVAKNERLGLEIIELSSVEHGRTKLLVEELAEGKKKKFSGCRNVLERVLALSEALHRKKKSTIRL